MTFDELWRMNLPRKDSATPSIKPLPQVDFIDGSPSTDSDFKDPDPLEIERFLQWLEQSLHSDDSRERS